jgi:hypothetical protein
VDLRVIARRLRLLVSVVGYSESGRGEVEPCFVCGSGELEKEMVDHRRVDWDGSGQWRVIGVFLLIRDFLGRLCRFPSRLWIWIVDGGWIGKYGDGTLSLLEGVYNLRVAQSSL